MCAMETYQILSKEHLAKKVKAQDVEIFLRDIIVTAAFLRHDPIRIKKLELEKLDLDKKGVRVIYTFQERDIDREILLDDGEPYYHEWGMARVTEWSWGTEISLWVHIPAAFSGIDSESERTRRERYEWFEKLGAEILERFGETEEQPKAEEVKELPSCPKVGTKPFVRWQAAWRKVKGHWKGGSSYSMLAKQVGVSEDTIAKIVKAGDAGLLD